MFVDIVGFSEFARAAPPDELIGALNDLFFAFDEITTRTGLLKVASYYIKPIVLYFNNNHTLLKTCR
jgi:hypothetical protein